jgi:L-ascorbate metabolism protein UlaG (beta-lactamase superfamily)
MTRSPPAREPRPAGPRPAARAGPAAVALAGSRCYVSPMPRSPRRWARTARRLLLLLALLLVVAVVWLARTLRDRPDLEPYAARLLDEPPRPGSSLSLTFLGVSTLLVGDGETALLTDGFFTRPGLLRTTLGRVAPDPEVIGRSLEGAGITTLAAVLVVHSHYDHAMDAPEVARRTGAVLVGSASTANVGRGWGLAEEQIRIVRPGEPMTFGAFRVTMIASRHFPHGMAMGEISAPLVPPVRATDYREGGSYSVLIEHPRGTLLVQASAGWVDGALRPYRADVVLLGVAGLGTRDEAYRQAYWREVVEATGARRVVPIHWDDFTLPLDEPLRPLPRRLDDFDVSMRFLLERAGAAMEVRLAPPWRPVDPLASLPDARRR